MSGILSESSGARFHLGGSSFQLRNTKDFLHQSAPTLGTPSAEKSLKKTLKNLP